MKLFENSFRKPLFQKALQICRLLQQAGGRAYFVGGCVRDALLGRPAADIDIEIYHLNEAAVRDALKDSFELEAAGMSFGVLKVHHAEIDLALPRVENKTGAGHRGFLVETMPDLPVSEAAARRDFTINAIMYDPLREEIEDPWNGRRDLEEKILRHVSFHFSEDPLRVLRAMQFAARFELRTAPETVALCRDIRQEELAAERIASEWEKFCLKSVRPSLGLRFLRDCGWIRYYPEIKASAEELLDRAVPLRTGGRDDVLALFLALLAGTPEDASSLASRVWRRNDLAKQASLLAETVPELLNGPHSDAELRRLALRAVRPALLLAAAEARACPDISNLRERFRALGIETEPPSPWVQGRHLLPYGIPPGPRMGEILRSFFEAQLSGVYRTPEEAFAALAAQYGPADEKNSVSGA